MPAVREISSRSLMRSVKMVCSSSERALRATSSLRMLVIIFDSIALFLFKSWTAFSSCALRPVILTSSRQSRTREDLWPGWWDVNKGIHFGAMCLEERVKICARLVCASVVVFQNCVTFVVPPLTRLKSRNQSQIGETMAFAVLQYVAHTKSRTKERRSVQCCKRILHSV